MSSANFNFYGVRVRVNTSEFESLISDLKRDLEFFSSVDSGGAVDIEIEVGPDMHLVLPRLRMLFFKTRMCMVYDSPAGRFCVYPQGTVARITGGRKKRNLRLMTKNKDLAFEIVYTFLLSAAGEFLDRRGWHRLHAAGFSYSEKNILISLPIGGGKSSLTTLLLREGAKIFSDEMPLLRKREIAPFPVRIALRKDLALKLGMNTEQAPVFRRVVFPEKILFPIEKKDVALVGRCNFLLIGKRAKGSLAEIRPVGRLGAAFRILPQLVFGLGLVQMAEFMLRPRMIPSLAYIALQRALVAIQVCSSASVWEFDFVGEPEDNLNCLKSFLSRHSP